MDLNEPDVIGVCLPLLHLLHSVVVVHTQAHIICTSNYPIFPDDETSTSHRVGSDFEAFYQGLQPINMNEEEVKQSTIASDDTQYWIHACLTLFE